MNPFPRFRFLACLNVDHLDFTTVLIVLSFNLESKTSGNVICYSSVSEKLNMTNQIYWLQLEVLVAGLDGTMRCLCVPEGNLLNGIIDLLLGLHS